MVTHPVRALPLLLLAVLLVGTTAGQTPSDLGRTTRILGGFETPQLAPGESGTLRFVFTNPYPRTMEGTRLEAEIYRFVSGDTVLAPADLEAPPVFATSGDVQAPERLGDLAPETSRTVELTVRTDPRTPAGGFFTQGTYLVRFTLAFTYPEGDAFLVSSGHFTLEEWVAATPLEPTEAERAAYRYDGNLNLTYLAEALGVERVDGVLPNTAFGVKVPLPVWPFQLLAAGSVAALGLAAYHYWRERRPPNL